MSVRGGRRRGRARRRRRRCASVEEWRRIGEERRVGDGQHIREEPLIREGRVRDGVRRGQAVATMTEEERRGGDLGQNGLVPI
jgi:hypothetical protein